MAVLVARYFDARAQLGASLVGLVAVGTRKMWISLFSVPCSVPEEVEAVWHKKVDFQLFDSGASKRKRGIGVTKEEEWRTKHKDKHYSYIQNSPSKEAVTKTKKKTAKKPTAKKPTARKPVAEKLAARKPATRKATGKRSARKA